MERLFKYYPDDFGKLPVRVIHMDLDFDVYDDHTKVASRLVAETLGDPLAVLQLNARNLEIISVACEDIPCTHEYHREDNILAIRFPRPVPPGTRFAVRTETVCRPTKNVLEGLYYDATPPGAPPTQITQCQQWGFQRLVPCIDDMTAKCTYSTTITADERYTHLISNGDVAEEKHPVGNGRARVRYDNTKTPMAPYLFFLGALTCAGFVQEFEYPDGRTFQLELLVPPGSDPRAAGEALSVLSDAVLWVHLFTGKDQYDHQEIRRELYDLCHERDRCKSDPAGKTRLSEIRSRLQVLAGRITPGYTYTGTVYREVGMQNSDFGGMENVGNTTITMNRIMPFSQMTDPSYEYMVKVKVHEYYHNQNGSEVTGKSPFELWLNEAVTVFVEVHNHGFLFGPGYSRLQTILTLLAPSGTLALDAGAASLPIEPDGFDDPNDLITGITYVKGPEFVRMIETLAGEEQFARGLALYHSRFSHGNASRSDWIAAMEEAAGQDFAEMAHVWLKQTNYPVVGVRTGYDPATKTVSFALRQELAPGKSPWIFPFTAAFVDESGNDLGEVTRRVTGKEESFESGPVPRPAFISINRGYAMYGKVRDDATPRQLALQARKDSDLVNRFLAFHRLAGLEILRQAESPGTAPSPDFIGLYGDLIFDPDLMARAGGQFLTIFETSEDERYAHRYRVLYEARKRLLQAIAGTYRDRLIQLYHSLDRPSGEWEVKEQAPAIRARQVRNTCLWLLSTLDTPESWSLARLQFERASCMTDRLSAFTAYLNSTAPDRLALLERFGEDARHHPVSWEAFLSAVASSSADDTVALVRIAGSSPAFRIEQSNDQRALFGVFSQNRKISLETPEGRALMKEIIARLAPVNEYSTVGILRAYGHLDRMDEAVQTENVAVLADFLASLDPQKVPSVYNTIRRLLIGAPTSVAQYEARHGAIQAIR
ncbi:MAG: M1 family metallopeptidase [Methanoregulaceae archaeon]|nr:M1 family metallopeptidase [Methanoregulaceae archaeon]